jgi:aryl-alcohol dehydrogenase-like predicted oxidoreductase
MKLRPLGKTGIMVSEIGFGTWGIGGEAGQSKAYGPANDEESIRTLEAAYSRGVNFYDTSNFYGWGHSEELLGQVFEKRRDKVLFATKAGFINPAGEQDFSADSVLRSLEGSLKRLRTNYVDVFQLHSPERSVLSDHLALWPLLNRLQAEGAIRCIGISARSPEDALAFVKECKPSCVQVNFNLTDLRALQNGLFDLCRREAVGIVVRTPLAFGFLTGRVGPEDVFHDSDHRRRFSLETRTRWSQAVELVKAAFSGSGQATPAQNALRFCLSYDCVSTAIPGMMEIAHVEDNLAAAELELLDANSLRTIEAVYDEHFK